MPASEIQGDFRFPRTARLLRPHEFERVFASGRRVNGGMFRLHLCAQTGLPEAGEPSRSPARLGVAVPKRIANRAVERNRIRRIVREDFRSRRRALPAADYVLVAQREANTASAEALRQALASLWRRAEALKAVTADPTIRSALHRQGAGTKRNSPKSIRDTAGAVSRLATARPHGTQED